MPRLRAIKTPRLHLRPPVIEDTKILQAAIENSFDTLHQWMPWARMIPSLQTTHDYLTECIKIWRAPLTAYDECPMQVMDKRERHMIGATGFKPHHTEAPTFEVGYWVCDAYQGQGYMTEAVNGVVRFLFEQYKAKRVEIQCEVANTASAGVAERLGFELEAVMKNYTLTPDGSKPSDVKLYACTALDRLPDLSVKWY